MPTVWRAVAFYPLNRPGYRAWLTATPWTSRKPLPLGPVHLVLQDVLLLGAAMLGAWLIEERWFAYVPQVFLTTYLTILAGTLFQTGSWPWGYAVSFGLGLVVHLWLTVEAASAAAMAVYLVAYLGLRDSLARFPWEEKWMAESSAVMEPFKGQRVMQDVLGWPFGRLAPRFPGSEFRIPVHHALLIGLLAGWLVFAFASLATNLQDRDDALRLTFIPLAVIAAGRIGYYCFSHLPPISLLGRLARFRWIIPGYDKVFVAPLLSLALGVAIYVAGRLLQWDALVLHPVIIAVVLFVCLGMGPSYKAWRLTGEHRIVEGTLRAGAVRVG